MFDPNDDFDPDLAELEELSNAVLDLIGAGKLEEAERQCRELHRRFPQTIDWIERTADVAEAKGETARAIEHYARCIDYIDRNPEDFDEAGKAHFRRAIDRLETERRVR